MSAVKRVAMLIDTSRSYGQGILRGAAGYNWEHGQWSVFYQMHGPNNPPPAWLRRWKGDGILAQICDRRMAKMIIERGVPTVDLKGTVGNTGLPVVCPDDQVVAQMAFQRLFERGFCNFAFCGPHDDRHTYMDIRCDSFKQLVEGVGYRCRVFRTLRERSRGDVWEQQQKKIANWVRSLPKPVGVMACDDEQGVLLLDGCRRAGVVVPNEVAVIGVDNDEYLYGLSGPPLTSVDVNPEQVGYEAARLLDRIMAGNKAPSLPVRLPPRRVVVRQSTDVLATKDQLVARAVAFIHDNAGDRIQVADVLRQVKVSRAVLEPRMKSVLGRTIYEEIRLARIEKIKRLLSGTDLPLKQIAHQCGFKYQQYMARAFRRITGRTLSEFRNKIEE